MHIDMLSNVCYYIVMSNNTIPDKVYTPEQVATMLQLSKNTVYELIGKGEIAAKRFGRVYRIPASSLSFMFIGLDADLRDAERNDAASLDSVHKELSAARKGKSKNIDDFAIASEESFAKDWLRPEEEEAWKVYQ
jgi:excisionase family DNA binding protein